MYVLTSRNLGSHAAPYVWVISAPFIHSLQDVFNAMVPFFSQRDLFIVHT